MQTPSGRFALPFFAIVALSALSATNAPDAPPVSLVERTQGCAICARMVEELTPDEFHDDAHDIPCGACHHPHTRRPADQWRATCTESGCHPRAWTETVMHRLDPEVFKDCRNCHRPHVFTANASDCASCHGSGPAEPVNAGSLPGAGAFPHDRHGEIPCGRCHESETKHATLVLASADACQDCHHGPGAVEGCQSCHDARGEVAARSLPMVFEPSVWKGAKTREISFDHDRHAGMECVRCHAGPDFSVVGDCQGCHEGHHRMEADCATCHRTPADGAHTLAVHETRTCSGSGCHQGGFEAMALERNFCVACHEDLADHHPERNCAGCHKLEPTWDQRP